MTLNCEAVLINSVMVRARISAKPVALWMKNRLIVPKKIKRKTHFSDAVLSQKAKVILRMFEEDKTEFINFDADFDDPYSADFLSVLNAVDEFPDDETLVDRQAQLTRTFKLNMKRCRDKFNDAKYYIEKVFPENKTAWNEFGYNRYDSARRNFIKTDSLMTLFHAVAIKYFARLAAVNYTQAMIDAIETIRQALHDAWHEQSAFKKSRPVLTVQRISKINELYDKIIEINRASKRIFKKDYARWQRYLLPATKKASAGAHDPVPAE